MVETNYLEHYGVLGMKWGVRRSQDQLDGAAGRYREKESKKALKKESRYRKELARSIKSKYDAYGHKADHVVKLDSAMSATKKLELARKELKALSSMTTSELLTERGKGRTYAMAYLSGPIGATIATRSIINKYPEAAMAIYDAGYDINYKSASRISREMKNN